MANHTKTVLAATLKDMMTTTDLDHITIEGLTDRAGVTRNTFYYHFTDIYALLKWIYDQEIVTQVQRYAQITSWQTAYALLLDYIEANRAFCIASFHSVGREFLEKLLSTVTDQLVRRVVRESAPTTPQKIEDAIVNFFGLAFVAQIIQWLMFGLSEPKQNLVNRASLVLDGALANAIENASKRGWEI